MEGIDCSLRRGDGALSSDASEEDAPGNGKDDRWAITERPTYECTNAVPCSAAAKGRRRWRKVRWGRSAGQRGWRRGGGAVAAGNSVREPLEREMPVRRCAVGLHNFTAGLHSHRMLVQLEV